MKKAFFTLSVLALLAATPVARAAFVPKMEQGISMEKAPNAEVPEAEGFRRTAKVPPAIKVQKKGFFAKLKRVFAPAGKSRLLAALLAILLWPTGANRFYLGYIKQGIWQLILGVFGYGGLLTTAFLVSSYTIPLWLFLLFLLGALALFAVSLWAFADFIRILTGDLQPENGAYKE